jgi:hypothetical protein
MGRATVNDTPVPQRPVPTPFLGLPGTGERLVPFGIGILAVEPGPCAVGERTAAGSGAGWCRIRRNPPETFRNALLPSDAVLAAPSRSPRRGICEHGRESRTGITATRPGQRSPCCGRRSCSALPSITAAHRSPDHVTRRKRLARPGSRVSETGTADGLKPAPPPLHRSASIAPGNASGPGRPSGSRRRP